MSTLTMTKVAWLKILDELHKEYPKSVFAIREKMKTKLGFTVREHRGNHDENGYLRSQIHLDFYNECKRTMFELKFSELINIKDRWFS